MRSYNLIYTLFFSFFLYLPVSVTAQKNQIYTGFYQLEKYQGNATYEYHIANGDTILDGTFQLESSDLEALLKKKDTSFSIKGKFDNNIPKGYWTFRFNEFRSDSASTIEKYQYVISVNGTQKVITGSLKDGKPDGIWTFALQEIQNSQIATTTFQSEIEFKNGVPQQNFTIQNDDQELIGRFLRNGMAHDEWTLYSDTNVEASESWRFNEGILESIRLETDEGPEIIRIHDTAVKPVKTIYLNQKYFDIIKLKLPDQEFRKAFDAGIIKILSRNDTNYQEIHSIFSSVSKIDFSPGMKVRVPFLPLSANEKLSLDEISALYAKSKKIRDSLLNNTQLNLLKISDKKVQVLEKSITNLSSRILDPLATILQFYNDEILSFVPRDELLTNLWPEGIPSIEYIDNTKTVISESTISKDLYSLNNIQKLSLHSFEYLDSIQHILFKKITKQKREQEAIDLEKKMIREVQYLEQLQDSLQIDSIPKVYVNTLEKIKENAADKLSIYSNIKNTDDKLEYARELVNCFEKLDLVGETITKIPAQQFEIQSVYQDAIWNPFTATIMNESVKKRLVSAYENVLIPYFLKEVEQGLSCDETTTWIRLVTDTYNRMLLLREMDTRRLERKLKNEEDPLVILDRLGIQPQNKEK